MAGSLFEHTITLSASHFPEDCDFIAFDKGCTLTKVCIGKRNGDSVTFDCRTYKSTDIDSVLDWLVNSGCIQSSTTVKITGVGGDIVRKKTADRLKCRVTFVDEFRAQKSGSELLIQHGAEDEVFYPDPKLMYDFTMGGDSEIWSEFAGRAVDKKNPYPTLFVYIGSAAGWTWIGSEDQKAIGGGTFLGGKTLLGLSSLVLDTTDFKEIDALAKKGDRSKIDLIGNDVFKDSKEPSYAALAGEMSIFHFGKLADGLVTHEQLSREDKAAALIGFFAEIFRTFVQASVAGKTCNRIVIGGNLVRSEYFREDCFTGHQATALFHGGIPLKFLQSGHTAAFGALLIEPLPQQLTT